MMHVSHREVFAANKELTQILNNFLFRAVVGYLCGFFKMVPSNYKTF